MANESKSALNSRRVDGRRSILQQEEPGGLQISVRLQRMLWNNERLCDRVVDEVEVSAPSVLRSSGALETAKPRSIHYGLKDSGRIKVLWGYRKSIEANGRVRG